MTGSALSAWWLALGSTNASGLTANTARVAKAAATGLTKAAWSPDNGLLAGFGAAGYCGLCDAQMLNATWVSWFKGHVDYGRSVGVELSAYTLMQHNGWGESVPAQWQTLNRDGGRGPAP